MLILGRKAGEAICIGDDVKISILEVDRYTVALGIVAPGCEDRQDGMGQSANSLDENTDAPIQLVGGVSAG